MQPGSDRLRAVEAQLAYTRIEHVTRDDARPDLLRARTLEPAIAKDPRSYDRRTCRVYDCSSGGFRPDLREHGFAHVDLSRLDRLQAALARVRLAGRLDDADVAELRRRLIGRTVPLHGGGRLWLLYLAREGFFMRRAGPNGLRLRHDVAQLGINDHDAAVSVHADQDVDGTPVKQLLRGAAPWLFHHDSPAHGNHLSRLFLVNLWIPLEQVTRPLALMDRRTLDRRAHQLRYGLPTDDFLQRDATMRVNDIWTFLHDDRQRWYFTSEMTAGTAYVFETLSTPHASFIVPGEERAEARYRQLRAAIEAVDRRDESALSRALAGDPDPAWRQPATASLQRAIAAIESSLAEARATAPALCRGDDPRQWSARASQAAERVVRKSIEMRAIAVLLPAVWPRAGRH